MKVLVLGGHGMAGHVIVDFLQEQGVEVVYTSRRGNRSDNQMHLDLRHQSDVMQVLDTVQPTVIVNAMGVLNQFAEQDLPQAVVVNSLLPHWLAAYGDSHGVRVIHISTDCVFSGRRGRYAENDDKDGTSVYAKTKSLGELNSPMHLTIRTSIIGPELKSDGIGLFDWFMRQTGDIRGYRRVWWNGVTTLVLAKVVFDSLTSGPTGLVHLASRHAVSKYELLQTMQRVFDKSDVRIRAYDGVVSDKTLLNTREDFTPEVPPYDTMLADMLRWMRQHHHRYASNYPLA